MTWLGLWRYDVFRAGVDQGIFTQVVAGSFRGFSSTVEGNYNHLLVHWSPVLVVAAPFVWAWGGRGLVVVQSLLLAATAFPLYGLARARASAPAAFGVTAIAMLYTILWAEAFLDFHELSFAPPLAATLVWALDRRRWIAGIVAALALACVKEDQFVVLAFAGALVAATSRSDGERRRFGFAVGAIGICAALAYFLVIRPAIHPYVGYWSFHYYDWSFAGPSPNGVVGIWSPERVLYLVKALAPLAFLPLGSRYVLFAIPGFAEVLASHEGVTLAIGAHYTAVWSGFVLAAFADTTATLLARRPPIGAIAALAAFAAALWCHENADPMGQWYYLYRRPNAHDALLESVLRTVPKGGGAGAEDQIFAHLATDPTATVTMTGQRYFVFDRTQYSPQWHDVDEPKVRLLLREGAYRPVFDRDGIIVIQKKW